VKTSEIEDEKLLEDTGITIVPVYEVRGHGGLVLMTRDTYEIALHDSTTWLRHFIEHIIFHVPKVKE